MEINNISSMYQTKLQEINSKIPDNLSVKNKFSTYLENAKLGSAKAEETVTNTETSEEVSDNSDTTKLLNSLLTYQTMTNSTASLFSNNSNSSNNMFPSMNNTLQQAILLKALKKGE